MAVAMLLQVIAMIQSLGLGLQAMFPLIAPAIGMLTIM